ncbi:MAG: tol-pal system protein YbgF [Proteobacteria bacterium]|nr:tol-pal system protein YbgF [Pseudomonadota bacterium]
MQEKTKKEINRLCCLPSALAICVLLVLGCGSSKISLEETIHKLEQEVARLKTERINFEARSSSLDDKVIVYKKKLSRCQEDKRPLLNVVRLVPGSDEEMVPVVEPKETIPSGVEIKGDKKRPKLILHEQRYRVKGSRPTSASPIQGGQDMFAAFQPENLDVIPQDTDSKDRLMAAFNTAYQAYSNKEHDKALAMFSNFIRDNPTHPYADNAVFWRGECYLAVGKFFNAIGEFERLIRRYPKSEKTPSGLLRIGFAYDQLHDRAKALEYYFRVVDKFPGSDAARRASSRVSAIQNNKKRQASNLMPTAIER